MDGKALMKYYEALLRIRQPWESLWREIAEFIVPRRYPGMGGTVLTPSTAPEARLFDGTAVHAHQINAAGCLAWMTPADSAWFGFNPPRNIKDDSAKKWLAEAGEASRETLARTNFYTAIHEAYLDRSGFGTCALYCEPDDEDSVFFQCWSTGTFVIGEDHKGRVNTVGREFELTAEQAVEKFGEENVSKKIRDAVKKGGDSLLEKFNFVHLILPRSEKDRQKEGATLQQQMPWACYYVDKTEQKVVRETGYPNFPVMVSRYLEWGTGTGGVYGWSPAFAALPAARQVNFLQKYMDALAEKMAFPPWLVPADMEGEVDPNAAGVTYIPKSLQAHEIPREMPTQGRYDVGVDRVRERQAEINKAFHVDMFQMLASMEKSHQMTAREISERASEKLVTFSPTFARMTTELLNPLCRWLFTELLGQGVFGDIKQIPPALLSEDQAQIRSPHIRYSSRIALALEQLPTIGMFRTLELAGMIAAGTQSPAVFDNLDVDKAVRAAHLSNGGSADVLVPVNQVQQLRQARAEAQKKAEEMAMAEQAAGAAGKLGGIKADSPVAKLLNPAA